MHRLDRLEDLTLDWQHFSADAVEKAADQLADCLSQQLPDPLVSVSSEQVHQLKNAADQGLGRAARELVEPCLDWLKVSGQESRAMVRARMDDALKVLPCVPLSITPLVGITPWAWVVPAGIGALIGSLGGALLVQWLFSLSEKELLTARDACAVGLLLGGVLGAVALVGVFAAITSRPAYSATLRALVSGQAPVEARSIRDTLAVRLARIAAGLFFPRPVPLSRADCRFRLYQQLLPVTRHHADLVLAWCWSACQAVTSRPPAPTGGDDLTKSVIEALTVLRGVRQDLQASAEDLRDAADSLLQRAETEGFVWHTIPRGTPYEETMAEEFDPYAPISPGQPIETLQAAVLHGGTVKVRGLLRRLREGTQP
jgi:hypothetical protein